MSSRNNDIITIITVVYNGCDVIENTIRSVIGQTYPNIEYIIIDGGSTDGTTDIIKKYTDKIQYWRSEPDKGVYDAMNKGIDRATGQWINFMNAGDYFYSPEAVEKIFANHDGLDEYAIVYGDAQFRIGRLAYIVKATESSNSNEFMPFSHQASFVRSQIAKQTKFDLKYRIAADTAFCLRLIREGHRFKYIPLTVCSYNAADGLSADNDVRRSKELVAMQVELNDADPGSPYFRKYIRKAYIRQWTKKLIPAFIWRIVRENRIKKTYQYTIND